MTNRYAKHQVFLKQVLLRLAVLQRDCRFWENATGKVRTDQGRWIKFGLKGSADIIGISDQGRFLSIEIKTGQAVQNEGQKNFEEMINKRNGLYIVFRDNEDIDTQIKRAFKEGPSNY